MDLFKRKKDIKTAEKIFERKTTTIQDIVAPASVEVGTDHLKLGNRLAKTFFIFSYPRYLSTGWFSPIINLDNPMDIGMFIHPIETGTVLKKLRRKVTEVQAEITEKEEKGLIRDPQLEIAHQDLEGLRNKLQTAQERMFRFGLYLTIYGSSPKELREIETTLRSILEARLIYIKPALYQQKEAFNTCLPYGLDHLQVHTSMNTEPLSSIFPFVSFDLSSNEGILHGINRHNNSLILFDRFSLENANSVIFAKSGSGKSYAIKLEVLRSLMTGIDSIIVDPENEYKMLADAVGGSFFDISLGSENHINPFDLPIPREGEKPENILRSNIIN
ncbi:MAG: conjugal transfer protein TraC, partial [Parcubacteria group bacterium]|nr:conjugal transfer protein TraC [Parcubacteria group bacterium]